MNTTTHAGSTAGIDLADLMTYPSQHGTLVRLADVKCALARATPQHSVTEQAREFPPLPETTLEAKVAGYFVKVYGAQHMRDYARAYAAQPLASTATTQPEQASDFAVRFIEQRAQKYLDENAHSDWDTGSVIFNCGEAGQDYYNSLVELADDIRAALAIPASTAASEQQAGADELPDASRFTGEIMAKLDEYGMAVRDDNADWRSRVRGEMFDAVYDRAALSGRATIPSEADERALFDAYMKTPAPDDYDASVKDAWLIWQEAWRAALTHRATTAADQQGDTAMEMMCNPAWGEPDLHARLVRFCRTELPLAQRQSKVQEWVEAVASTTAYMARDFGYREDPAQQGAAQAQAGDARAPDGWVAVALICGEPTSVAFRDEDAARAVCIEGVPFPFVRVSTKESA